MEILFREGVNKKNLITEISHRFQSYGKEGMGGGELGTFFQLTLSLTKYIYIYIFFLGGGGE